MKKVSKIKCTLSIILLIIFVVANPFSLIRIKLETVEGNTSTKYKFMEEEVTEEANVTEKKAYEFNISGVVLKSESISKVRENAEKSMSILGTDKSKYNNIAKSNIIPIITDKDKIYNLKLERLDGNELDNNMAYYMYGSREIVDSYKVYRNDRERVKTKLNITNGTNIEDLIEFAEIYMNFVYRKSPFKWVVENVQVSTAYDKQDYAQINIRPSYDGVVFKRTDMFKDGKPTDLAACATDFRKGTLYVKEMNKIYGYSSISPNYKVERQGEAITEILSIESVLSIVANRIDEKSVSDIRVFELAYRLNRDLTAIPVWNIVIRENGSERNFQIDAVTGYIYFE